MHITGICALRKMRMGNRTCNGISSSGAGYSLDKKAWHDARLRGLERAIRERLRLFGRPVSAELLMMRLADKGFDVGQDEVTDMLERMAEHGDVAVSDEGYALNDKGGRI